MNLTSYTMARDELSERIKEVAKEALAEWKREHPDDRELSLTDFLRDVGGATCVSDYFLVAGGKKGTFRTEKRFKSFFNNIMRISKTGNSEAIWHFYFDTFQPIESLQQTLTAFGGRLDAIAEEVMGGEKFDRLANDLELLFGHFEDRVTGLHISISNTERWLRGLATLKTLKLWAKNNKARIHKDFWDACLILHSAARAPLYEFTAWDEFDAYEEFTDAYNVYRPQRKEKVLSKKQILELLKEMPLPPAEEAKECSSDRVEERRMGRRRVSLQGYLSSLEEVRWENSFRVGREDATRWKDGFGDEQGLNAASVYFAISRIEDCASWVPIASLRIASLREAVRARTVIWRNVDHGYFGQPRQVGFRFNGNEFTKERALLDNPLNFIRQETLAQESRSRAGFAQSIALRLCLLQVKIQERDDYDKVADELLRLGQAMIDNKVVAGSVWADWNAVCGELMEGCCMQYGAALAWRNARDLRRSLEGRKLHEEAEQKWLMSRTRPVAGNANSVRENKREALVDFLEQYKSLNIAVKRR